MSRWNRTAVWVLFAGVMYLILTEAVWPWIHLPQLGNIGFTLVFVLFALAHCAALEGWGRTGIFFAVSAVVSYFMEEIGVQTGIVFGRYHYGDLLGAKLGHVPVIIPLAWFMMIYPSWMVARAILTGLNLGKLPGITALAAVAAFVMTGWDVVMDPGMAAEGNWVWEHGGAYFGVPRHNYLGWLATTFLVYWIAGWLWREVSRTLTRVCILCGAVCGRESHSSFAVGRDVFDGRAGAGGDDPTLFTQRHRARADDLTLNRL